MLFIVTDLYCKKMHCMKMLAKNTALQKCRNFTEIPDEEILWKGPVSAVHSHKTFSSGN